MRGKNERINWIVSITLASVGRVNLTDWHLVHNLIEMLRVGYGWRLVGYVIPTSHNGPCQLLLLMAFKSPNLFFSPGRWFIPMKTHARTHSNLWGFFSLYLYFLLHSRFSIRFYMFVMWMVAVLVKSIPAVITLL